MEVKIKTQAELEAVTKDGIARFDGDVSVECRLKVPGIFILAIGSIRFSEWATVWGIEAGGGIKAGSDIEALFVFSFRFEVGAKFLKTKLLPFWREFYAAMPPLAKWAALIRDEHKCWNDLRKAVTREESEEIVKWDGWHPLIAAQLRMFFGLVDRVELGVGNPEQTTKQEVASSAE